MPVLEGVQFRGVGFSQPNTPRVPTASIGDGLQQIGGALKGAANVLDVMAEDDGRIYFDKTNAQARLKAREAMQAAETSGEDLTGISEKLAKSAEEDWKAAYDAAPNGHARRFMDMAKEETLGDIRYSATELETKFRTIKRSNEIVSAFDLKANEAATDPGSFPRVYAEAQALLKNTVGIPFETRMQLESKLGSIASSAVAGMIDSNPYAAEAQLKSGQWDKYLDPGDRVSLYNRAVAGIKSLEAEARARAAEGRAAAAEAAGEYLAQIDDDLAYVAAGNVPTPEMLTKYDPAVIAALPIKGADKLAKKTADAFARGEGIRDLLNAGTPAERAKVIQGWREKAADPENFQFNQDTLRILESGAADLNDKLVKDPGGVAEMSMRVQEAIKSGDGAKIVAASYAEQERQNVPEYARKPLSNAYAAQLADQIGALPPEEQGKAMQELQASYGSAWPDVMQQMGTKLPGGLAVASVMPRNPDGTANRAATTLASVASLKIDDLTTGLEKGAKGDAEEAILDDERMQSLNRMLGSQVGGRETFAQYQDSVLRLTLTYMGNGMDKDDAAAKAAQEITADTDFREVDNSMVGIPASANPDMVEAGMRAAVGRLDVAKLDLPPSVSGMADADARAALASNIQRNAEWVPDGKGKGLYLRVIGEPVTIGGQPVFYSWDDLKSAALPQDGLMFEAGR